MRSPSLKQVNSKRESVMFSMILILSFSFSSRHASTVSVKLVTQARRMKRLLQYLLKTMSKSPVDLYLSISDWRSVMLINDWTHSTISVWARFTLSNALCPPFFLHFSLNRFSAWVWISDTFTFFSSGISPIKPCTLSADDESCEYARASKPDETRDKVNVKNLLINDLFEINLRKETFYRVQFNASSDVQCPMNMYFISFAKKKTCSLSSSNDTNGLAIIS